jgi:hypothetical protein
VIADYLANGVFGELPEVAPPSNGGGELRYLYCLRADARLFLPEYLFRDAGLRVEAATFANRWIDLRPEPSTLGGFLGAMLTVREGYAWDGCSIKRKWTGGNGALRWWGTPEGQVVPWEEAEIPAEWRCLPRTYPASLTHDCLYQFGGDIAAAWGIRWHPTLRLFADLAFRDRLIRQRFTLSSVYYRAVRIAGAFMHRDRK